MNISEIKRWRQTVTHASAFNSFESCNITTCNIDWLISEVDRLTAEIVEGAHAQAEYINRHNETTHAAEGWMLKTESLEKDIESFKETARTLAKTLEMTIAERDKLLDEVTILQGVANEDHRELTKIRAAERSIFKSGRVCGVQRSAEIAEGFPVSTSVYATSQEGRTATRLKQNIVKAILSTISHNAATCKQSLPVAVCAACGGGHMEVTEKMLETKGTCPLSCMYLSHEAYNLPCCNCINWTSKPNFRCEGQR